MPCEIRCAGRRFSLNLLLTNRAHIRNAAKAFVRHACTAWQCIDLLKREPAETCCGFPFAFRPPRSDTISYVSRPASRSLVLLSAGLEPFHLDGEPMSYLSRLADYADSMLHGSTAQQVGGLCYRKGAHESVEVLLITTRETKRWTIPKGWPIKGLEPHEAAKLEAWEEAGVKGKVKKKPFGYFTYLKTLTDGRTVPSVVQVHLLETRTTRSHFPERRQRELMWLPASQTSLLVDEPELNGLFGKFSRRTAFR